MCYKQNEIYIILQRELLNEIQNQTKCYMASGEMLAYICN